MIPLKPLEIANDPKNTASFAFIDQRGESEQLVLDDEQADELGEFAFDHLDKDRSEHSFSRLWVRVRNPDTGRRVSAALVIECCPQEGGGYELGNTLYVRR